jgi:hypothetical protein
MLSTLQGLSLLTIVEIIGPIVLACALAYGLTRASRRPQGPVERKSVKATAENYKQEGHR